MPVSYFKDPHYPDNVISFTPTGPSARDGDYSHPWVWNGTAPVIDPNWQNNLLLFFQDLKTYGMSASPSLAARGKSEFFLNGDPRKTRKSRSD